MSDHTLVDTECADCGTTVRVSESALEAAVGGNVWCGECTDYEPGHGDCDPFGDDRHELEERAEELLDGEAADADDVKDAFRTDASGGEADGE